VFPVIAWPYDNTHNAGGLDVSRRWEEQRNAFRPSDRRTGRRERELGEIAAGHGAVAAANLARNAVERVGHGLGGRTAARSQWVVRLDLTERGELRDRLCGHVALHAAAVAILFHAHALTDLRRASLHPVAKADRSGLGIEHVVARV
jgi:hypothetical protein